MFDKRTLKVNSFTDLDEYSPNNQRGYHVINVDVPTFSLKSFRGKLVQALACFLKKKRQQTVRFCIN